MDDENVVNEVESNDSGIEDNTSDLETDIVSEEDFEIESRSIEFQESPILNDSLLLDIKNGVDNIEYALTFSDQALPLLSVAPESSGIEGYYVDVNGYRVYFPVDRVQYLSKTSSGQLINLSSSTIYCYSLDNNGNRTNYYRLQSFGTMERQYQSGYNTYWESVGAYHQNSNIILGQTGIHNFTEFALFFILIFVGVIAIFRKGR